MKPNLINQISNYLLLSIEEIIEMADRAPTSYKRYLIPKKNKSGNRIIFHPSKQTKSLQYALIECLLIKFPVHKSAVAYKRGLKSPLLVNAQMHSKYSFSIHLDFKDFFPSIKANDFIDMIKEYKEFDYLDADDLEFIKKALFVKYYDKHQLAIGAPSSPIISNIVMYNIDEQIEVIAKSISGNSTYTRYADDIVFSTDLKGGCNTFHNELKKLVSKTNSPKLRINEMKTIYTSKGTRRVVTGLYICPDTKISLGRKNKRYIKKLVFDFKNGKISSESLKYLSGYISFIIDVEPDFYNRLALKYTSETLKEIRESI